MESFGEFIRNARTARGLLLREVAAALQVDPSLLSRVERGVKRLTRDQVIQLAAILKTNESELLVHYLSERVVYQLEGEKLALKAIMAAEKKVVYRTKRKKDREE